MTGLSYLSMRSEMGVLLTYGAKMLYVTRTLVEQIDKKGLKYSPSRRSDIGAAVWKILLMKVFIYHLWHCCVKTFTAEAYSGCF